MFVATLSANDHTMYDWIIDFGATQHDIRTRMVYHVQVHFPNEGVHGR
jgi:succinate dehydrogenase flavin-adding protein (antitoxin of CptAB toxin-antitoxin module)